MSRMQAEGPYHSLVDVPPDVPVVVVVAGGIGITSVLGQLRHWARMEEQRHVQQQAAAGAAGASKRVIECMQETPVGAVAGWTGPQAPRVYLVWSSRSAAGAMQAVEPGAQSSCYAVATPTSCQPCHCQLRCRPWQHQADFGCCSNLLAIKISNTFHQVIKRNPTLAVSNA